MRLFGTTRIFVVALLGSLLPAASFAADNSGIVIIDQSHRSTPFGSYDSRRQTQVFGPSTGYRYEEYSDPRPGVIISPYGYGYGYGSGRGRVVEQYGPGYGSGYGPGAYGRYGANGAPAAPRIDGYRNPYRHRGHDGRYDTDRRSTQRFGRDPSARQIQPAERAIQPSARAIDNNR